jgi:predicted transposase/invertase (TIGR01784 family)
LITQEEKGDKEEKQEIVRNLKALGLPIEKIAQGTGLTEKQLKELRCNIQNEPLLRRQTYYDKISHQELVDEIIEMDPAIKKAEAKLRSISMDDEILRLYELREKALSDWNSEIDHARKEGKEEEKVEIARNLKAIGIAIEKIAQGTGLTEEQIKKL